MFLNFGLENICKGLEQDLFLLYSTSNYYFYTTLVIVWSRKNVPQFSGVAKQIFLGGITFRED